MKTSLVPGIASVTKLTIDRDRTIDFMGEEARVYATPMLVRDIEIACRELLLAHLDPAEDSVGTRVEIEARDNVEAICRGRHSRLSLTSPKPRSGSQQRRRRQPARNRFTPDKDSHES